MYKGLRPALVHFKHCRCRVSPCRKVCCFLMECAWRQGCGRLQDPAPISSIVPRNLLEYTQGSQRVLSSDQHPSEVPNVRT